LECGAFPPLLFFSGEPKNETAALAASLSHALPTKEETKAAGKRRTPN
jgi:hypothetical protein